MSRNSPGTRYPLMVVVINATGDPVSGVTVNFAVTAGDGTLIGTQSITDGQGVAFAKLSMVGIGVNAVTATAPSLAGSGLSFTTQGVKKNSQLVSQ
jgi:hypothetical protein